MTRIYTQKNDIAVSVFPTYDGRELIVSFERHPLTASLGYLTPNEARTLASMLTEQAAKCDSAIADNQRVRDAAFEAAVLADEREVA